MVKHSGFGFALARLLSRRGKDAAWLSSESGIPERELGSVISGASPQRWMLDAMAVALGFRAADLYVMAGVQISESATPSDPSAGSKIVSLIQVMMALPLEQRSRVHSLVNELAQEYPDRWSDLQTPYSQHAGFGAMLANMLCGNRNLRSLTAAAKALALMTNGRIYLAASTVSGIGRGRVPLTSDLVEGFAITLGISVGDLAAITGVDPPGLKRPEDPLAAEMAEVLWNCRHLTDAQAEHLRSQAEAMLVPVPDGAAEEDWNRVHHHHGRWWVRRAVDTDTEDEGLDVLVFGPLSRRLDSAKMTRAGAVRVEAADPRGLRCRRARAYLTSPSC